MACGCVWHDSATCDNESSCAANRPTAPPKTLLPDAPCRGEGGQGMFAATPTNRSGAQICVGFRERP